MTEKPSLEDTLRSLGQPDRWDHDGPRKIIEGARRRRRRRRTAITAGTAAALMCVVGGILWLQPSPESTESGPVSETDAQAECRAELDHEPQPEDYVETIIISSRDSQPIGRLESSKLDAVVCVWGTGSPVVIEHLPRHPTVTVADAQPSDFVILRTTDGFVIATSLADLEEMSLESGAGRGRGGGGGGGGMFVLHIYGHRPSEVRLFLTASEGDQSRAVILDLTQAKN